MAIFPVPKPEPGRHKPGVIIRTNKSDGKTVEICRSSAIWQQRREDVGSEAGFLCEDCGRPAPLHDEEIEREEGVMPYLIRAGHAHHSANRRMGGGSRDDSRGGVEWLCHRCHSRRHVPAKVVPRKVR